MAKKVLWIVAAAAAVALMVDASSFGYPPVQKGTEATIGAAQRYQSPQISSADVKTRGCAAAGVPAERRVPSADVRQGGAGGAEEQGFPASAGRTRRFAWPSRHLMSLRYRRRTRLLRATPRRSRPTMPVSTPRKVKLDAVLASSAALRAGPRVTAGGAGHRECLRSESLS